MSATARTALVLLALAPAATAHGFDEALYARLLDRHTRLVVDDLARVRVDYAALAKSADWKRLVASLAESDASALRTREAKLAFWIDAYNVLAIDLVARHWPVESIRDIGSFWSPVWKRPAGVVGGREISLDEIEHGIVRPLDDPRAHAAVICASTSCPALPREPLREEILDAQLDAAMQGWLADPGKGLRIDRAAKTIHLSKIFDWFEEDFAVSGGVLATVARFAPETDRAWLRANGAGASITYFDYDWRVNASKR
jgi:hypothetical protein